MRVFLAGTPLGCPLSARLRLSFACSGHIPVGGLGRRMGRVASDPGHLHVSGLAAAGSRRAAVPISALAFLARLRFLRHFFVLREVTFAAILPARVRRYRLPSP